MRVLNTLIFLPVFLLGLATPAAALDSSAGRLKVETVASGLKSPWSFGFLPGGGVLITEKRGRLWYVGTDGQRRAVSGVGPVDVNGQGGLLDVLVPRDFAQSRQLYFSHALAQPGGGSGTAVATARLNGDASSLTGWRVIFEMERGSSGGRHFGSRLVEGRDGMLFVTVGERGDRPSAQDLGRENGSVLRISRDGRVPGDNPFVGTAGAQPEIWSYGHRNPQGATLDLRGQLWVSEHGAKGGDEVNRIRKGANFGWPVISYGRHYSGRKIGEGTAKPGMEQPAYYWDPSIAPSGLMIYSGRLWPKWRGHFFVGSLKFGHVARLSGQPLALRERIKGDETSRTRDIREAPDGTIWVLSEGQGALFRLSP
ncbi:PQQ-dependent sugar dehydrogenase [Pseudohalocynthiibacter aestuariivivens]|nr:PQQ-dependent sugar dehydrogenase [Pseudohalocynthiibacter aestuariivivens]QIE44513.1 PQQ-dependent sugar dehydrogenase [Pseudohalocynthiibacter aestuariivivens]